MLPKNSPLFKTNFKSLSGTPILPYALVRSLSKCSSPLEFKDFKPISILPCLFKVLEKVI